MDFRTLIRIREIRQVSQLLLRSIIYGYILEKGMAIKDQEPLAGEMLQGTLDLLILQTLVVGAAHGHTIAHAIERRSEDVLQVEHGSLYPALHRLQIRGWIASFWGTSENNRRARYYRLTPAGRKQLAEQTGRWDRLVRAVNQVLRPAAE
jgi:PadR family transcriptional regulator PadR